MSTAPAPASSTDQPAASPASAKEDHYFLPLNEASHTVDVKSGDVLTEALTKSPENPNAEHFLVAVHPDGQPKQSEKAIEMACKLSKPGDTVILLSVLPVVLLQEPGREHEAPSSPTCPTPWQIAALRKMRIDEAEKLLEKGNLFSDDVKIVASVVHGGVGPELLRVADEHSADYIILGMKSLPASHKPRLGSTAEYITSRAPCNVLLAK